MPQSNRTHLLAAVVADLLAAVADHVQALAHLDPSASAAGPLDALAGLLDGLARPADRLTAERVGEVTRDLSMSTQAIVLRESGRRLADDDAARAARIEEMFAAPVEHTDGGTDDA